MFLKQFLLRVQELADPDRCFITVGNENVVAAVNNYDFGHDVEIIAASIRSANHVTQAALMGADIATVPFAVLKKCVEHPLTDRGLEAFLKDWEKVQNA